MKNYNKIEYNFIKKSKNLRKAMAYLDKMNKKGEIDNFTTTRVVEGHIHGEEITYKIKFDEIYLKFTKEVISIKYNH